MIVAIAHSEDSHTTAVMSELKRMGAAATILDLANFPRQMQLEARYGNGTGRAYTLGLPGGEQIALSDCRSIWWRRPQPFRLHEDIQDPTSMQFAMAETSEAFAGLWPSLDVFWINHPTLDGAAHHKLFQLRIAQEVGLSVPETLVTNDPVLAREFVTRHGIDRTIYKAFSGTHDAWRETRLVKEREVSLIDSVRYAPVIFQEYIEAEVDLRITVVGSDIFPAAIHSQETTYPVDFRMDMANAKIEAHKLPAAIEEGLLALMAKLGLVYGAIDMRRTPDGEYVFLEINPAGQWLFVEARSEQPITKCLAALLANGH